MGRWPAAAFIIKLFPGKLLRPGLNTHSFHQRFYLETKSGPGKPRTAHRFVAKRLSTYFAGICSSEPISIRFGLRILLASAIFFQSSPSPSVLSAIFQSESPFMTL